MASSSASCPESEEAKDAVLEANDAGDIGILGGGEKTSTVRLCSTCIGASFGRSVMGSEGRALKCICGKEDLTLGWRLRCRGEVVGEDGVMRHKGGVTRGTGGVTRDIDAGEGGD